MEEEVEEVTLMRAGRVGRALRDAFRAVKKGREKCSG